MRLSPITPTVGTLVEGVDLRAELADGDFVAIYQRWIRTGLLLFRNQNLSPPDQLRFTSRLGELVSYTRDQFGEAEYPEILVLSNIEKNGKLIGTPVSGRVWHTDGHYLERPPAASVLYALETPRRGGDTLFASMRSAYDALPSRIKKGASGLRVVISRVQSRPYNYPDRPPPTPAQIRDWPDVSHPVIRTHPVSGSKAIYVGGNVPWRIEGLRFERSAPLITYLQEFSTTARFVYRHKWKPGDLLVWDNRSMMHKATPYDPTERRLLHRTTTMGDVPVE
jgi:taurine dioxygenase/putative 2-oxoglutarate oxygenase